MLEKEPDSMAVTMKQDYAASEVYSTTSEAPPAYKIRQANSVKIAKIIAITVVLSSFILGSFILASSYLQAKQSCDQMQALDAVLNKELMLEAMQQELPKAQALMQDNLSADESNLQTIDRDEGKKHKQEESQHKQHKEDSDESSDSEDEEDSSSDGESDESVDMNNRIHVKLPLDLHLTDLANAILRENQKSRMNCIVERRRSEEMVDSPAKMMRLPFGMDMATDPKQQKVTGERIAIFCESGNELKNEEAEPVRQVLIPIPPVRAFGPITHLPQQMGPQTIIRQMPGPMFRMPFMNPHHQPQPQQPQQQPQQLPPIPAQMMQAPHPDAPMGRPNFHPFLQQLPQIMAAQMHQQGPSQPQPGMPPRTEVRIHLQRIPLPEIMRPFLPPQIMRSQPEPEQAQPQPQQQPSQQPEQPQSAQPQEVQIREMPLEMAMHKFGMPSSEEMNVADFAAQKFTEQLRSLIARIAESEESEEETDSYRNAPNQEGPSPHSDERELQEQQPPRPTEPEAPHQDEQEQQQAPSQQPQQQQPESQEMIPMGRIHYGRSLLTPINLPGKVVETTVSEEEAVRPHYVQPRSV